MVMDKDRERTKTHIQKQAHNAVWGPGRKLTASELTHTLKGLMP